MSREPEEIHDPDHEIWLSRVAAIDVAKASGKVCTRLPHPTRPRRRITLVWDVASTTNEICALAQRLITDQIERVVLGSTSDYWRPFCYILEAHGVTVWLVNANDVKQVPGRPKTDKLDAVWLAKLNERGIAATVVRAAEADPGHPRLHPPAPRPRRRPDPLQAAPGEVAGRRADQAFVCGHQLPRAVRTRDDRRPGRR
jgi:hypothetical protein